MPEFEGYTIVESINDIAGSVKARKMGPYIVYMANSIVGQRVRAHVKLGILKGE
jgi:hypothetical protein